MLFSKSILFKISSFFWNNSIIFLICYQFAAAYEIADVSEISLARRKTARIRFVQRKRQLSAT